MLCFFYTCSTWHLFFLFICTICFHRNHYILISRINATVSTLKRERDDFLASFIVTYMGIRLIFFNINLNSTLILRIKITRADIIIVKVWFQSWLDEFWLWFSVNFIWFPCFVSFLKMGLLKAFQYIVYGNITWLWFEHMYWPLLYMDITLFNLETLHIRRKIFKIRLYVA